MPGGPMPGGPARPGPWSDPHDEGTAWDDPVPPDDEQYDEDEDEDDDSPRRGPVRSHSHAHAHGGGAVAVSARTRRIVMAILIPAMVVTAVMIVLLWPGKIHLASPGALTQTGQVQQTYGTVLSLIEQTCPPPPAGAAIAPSLGPTACGSATVEITEGSTANSTVTVDLPTGPGAPTLKVGDDVVLSVSNDPTSNALVYQVVDEQRGKPLLFMLALSAAIILAFARWRGLSALVALAVSFLALIFFVIPAILNGEPPLLVAVVGAIAIMFAVLYLTHGINVHTSVAILGTLISLVLTGGFGYLFTVLTRLTGYDEDSTNLSLGLGRINVRGLLLAGIIIGALGVLDDVTITQSSTVEELAATATSRLELYRAASRVGRNHIASAVNTIVMAYAGASLPLLLLIVAGGLPVGQIVTSQLIAQEIVRSAVGTIGLVASVPITTGLAALVADIRPGKARAAQRRARRRPTPA